MHNPKYPTMLLVCLATLVSLVGFGSLGEAVKTPRPFNNDSLPSRPFNPIVDKHLGSVTKLKTYLRHHTDILTTYSIFSRAKKSEKVEFKPLNYTIEVSFKIISIDIFA